MSTRQIKLGVVGLGRAFTLMLPTFLADARIALVAACDPRVEARAQFTRDFSCPTYESVEALAQDPNVEAIYIASPHQCHAEHTRIAAAHGKHVLVEKPMSISLAACDAMIADCEKANVKLIVGHSHSFDTPYTVTREIIERGDVGRVKMIHAINYTDFLYRPRRPEELDTNAGGGVVFSQGSHQMDVVCLLAGAAVTRVRAITGAWDATRPTEGAYAALFWFANGAFASLTYSGYGHFDTDQWCDWVGELGATKSEADYGGARRKLARAETPAEETKLKSSATYGGPDYIAPKRDADLAHQHFGSIIVTCERGDLRPMTDGVWMYSDTKREHIAIAKPSVPRREVIDELYGAVVNGDAPQHSGAWARSVIAVALALSQSARENRDVEVGG